MINIGLLYGGKSGEHEVSLESAWGVWGALDRSKFNPIAIAIDKTGVWRLGKIPEDVSQDKVLPLRTDWPALRVALGHPPRLHPENGGSPIAIDCYFPVVHGTFGEDGTLQGMLEMMGVPYVGSGTLGSSVAMDKDIAKRLLAFSGVPIVPYFVARPSDVVAAIGRRVEQSFGWPCFVKPANMGSSVGVHRVSSMEQLGAALADAFSYDEKVLVEQGIDSREIECSVLGNLDLAVSVPGEIVPNAEFYSYDAKYLDPQGAGLLIPAPLDEGLAAKLQALAGEVFVALELRGLARVDFLISKSTGDLYVNEANTIPGFTQISMYPKLWAASGKAYPALLSELIELALEQYRRRAALSTSFTVNH